MGSKIYYVALCIVEIVWLFALALILAAWACHPPSGTDLSAYLIYALGIALLIATSVGVYAMLAYSLGSYIGVCRNNEPVGLKNILNAKILKLTAKIGAWWILACLEMGGLSYVWALWTYKGHSIEGAAAAFVLSFLIVGAALNAIKNLKKLIPELQKYGDLLNGDNTITWDREVGQILQLSHIWQIEHTKYLLILDYAYRNRKKNKEIQHLTSDVLHNIAVQIKISDGDKEPLEEALMAARKASDAQLINLILECRAAVVFLQGPLQRLFDLSTGWGNHKYVRMIARQRRKELGLERK